jgi:hypothetical protein
MGTTLTYRIFPEDNLGNVVLRARDDSSQQTAGGRTDLELCLAGGVGASAKRER